MFVTRENHPYDEVRARDNLSEVVEVRTRPCPGIEDPSNETVAPDVQFEIETITGSGITFALDLDLSEREVARLIVALQRTLDRSRKVAKEHGWIPGQERTDRTSV